MGKKAKEHRKKVAKRNALINDAKKKQQKQAMDFLMNLIKKENASGAFDNPVQPIPGELEINTQPKTDNFAGPQI